MAHHHRQVEDVEDGGRVRRHDLRRLADQAPDRRDDAAHAAVDVGRSHLDLAQLDVDVDALAAHLLLGEFRRRHDGPVADCAGHAHRTRCPYRGLVEDLLRDRPGLVLDFLDALAWRTGGPALRGPSARA